jgi:hypothetical protein
VDNPATEPTVGVAGGGAEMESHAVNKVESINRNVNIFFMEISQGNYSKKKNVTQVCTNQLLSASKPAGRFQK